MPLLRSRTIASALATTSAGALVVLLVVTSLLSATTVRADTVADTGAGTLAGPASDPVADAAAGEGTAAVGTTSSAAIPAHFCPQPTGSWWEDISADGCRTALLGRDGRDGTAPLAARELSWLNLGALPAFATVDVEAIGAAIAAYELRIAEEKEAAAVPVSRPPGGGQPVQSPRRDQPYSDATVDRVHLECGYHDASPHSYEEQMLHWERVNACIESRMPGYEDWMQAAELERAGITVDPEQEAYEACLVELGPNDDILDRAASRAFFDAHARCVDRSVPGYYARWVVEEAEREVVLEAALAREAAAYARLLERQERALQEIRDTCPHGGIASPTKVWASSYDEVDYVVTCHDAPAG
jgi:hypothetical protein